MPNISNTIKDLIRELEVLGLSGEEKASFAEKLESYLQRVVLETVLAELDNEQLERFDQAVKSGENIEEKISEITEEIPGLAYKIEKRLNNEIGALKKMLEKK